MDSSRGGRGRRLHVPDHARWNRCGAPSPRGSGCIAHHPNYIEDVFEVGYAAGSSGHDEPELDPVSSAPGSARDLTWTIVLGSDGLFPVAATGPTFWFGGTVTDPTSLFGQAFYELQFDPDSIVTNCNPNGAFVVKFAPNTYSACSPVWSIHQTGTKGVFHEPAAFNAMLTDGGSTSPLIMHAGDTVTIHAYTTAARDGFHLTVTDRTTGHAGTIVLNSKSDGPLMPAFDTQQIGNALSWGLVNDTPNSFVGEIGHTSGTTGFHYGADFPETVNDYGKADQFAQTLDCGGPFGPDSTYCDTVIQP